MPCLSLEFDRRRLRVVVVSCLLSSVGPGGCLRSHCGPAESSVAACSDGRDNDGDDYFDCQDQDCLQFAPCVSDACATCADATPDALVPESGFADAASDGATDASVSADSGACTACPGLEVCDGIDNDGDSTVDF